MASKYPDRKAQTSVEYLIILGVILVIALIAIGLSLFFGQTQGDAVMQETRTYWSMQAFPIKVIDMQGYTYPSAAAGTTGEIALVLENDDTKPLNVTGLALDGETFSLHARDTHSVTGDQPGTDLGVVSNLLPANPGIKLSPGDQYTIYLRPPAACKYISGNPPTSFSRNLTITYRSRYFTGIAFKGAKPVAGKCSPSS